MSRFLKRWSLVGTLGIGMAAMVAGPQEMVFAATTPQVNATTVASSPAVSTMDDGTTSGSVYGSPADQSTAQSVYGPSPPQLHDFAPLSSVTVSKSGPSDVRYTKAESKHLNPLVGGTQWRGFCQQSGRNIVITLPVTVAVYSVSIEMEQVPKIGAFYPDHVDFEVNQNDTWYEADTVNSPIATWNRQNTKETITGHYGNVAATQIMIHFPVSGWVFARDIHVWGINASQAEAGQSLTLPPAPTALGQPMTTSDARDNGIQNMLLVYNDGTTPAGTWTARDFLPMAGYMAQNGSIQGRMFDTMLFLPTGKLANTQQSWYGFLSNLFSAGTQLSALNDAVGQVNDALAAKSPDAADYVEKVVIALPYPIVGRGVWGTVDGRKVSFNGGGHDPGAVNARATALEWYIQTLQNAWVGAGYTHLQLAGLYWLSERVNYQNPDDPALIQQASSLAQQANLPLLWIPYYDAAGIDNWQDEGFTAAWLQSHYLQGKRPDMHRLASAVSLAKDTGMGFEVEANWQTVSNAKDRGFYEAMLSSLEKNGMAGDVSHAYYAGSKVFVNAAYAKSNLEYGVYQKTYQFMQQ